MKSTVRYVGVSSIGVLVDLAIFFVFAKLLRFNYLWVAGIGFIIATFVNYELCVRFVFEREARFNKHHELLLIFIVSGMGLLLTQVILYIMVSYTKIELMTSKISATFIVFLWNYAARKHYIFKKI